jgi:hypothetical protein
LMGTAWNISYFILSLVWSSPLLAWPGRSCSVPPELARSGRAFYQSAMKRDSTSNFVARSGLSSSEYGGDRRNTNASTSPLQPILEGGLMMTNSRNLLTLIA